MTLNPGDILVYDGNNWVNSSFNTYTKVVLTQPAPSVQTNGLLSLGEGGFAGGANAFLGSSSGTVLAINTGSSYGGRLCEFQVGGQWKFLVGAGGLCQVINFTATGNQLTFSSAPAANAALGMLSIGNGGFTGAAPPNFSGSGSGTYLAMNAVSGYGGRLMDLQVAGVSQFSVGSVGLCTCVTFTATGYPNSFSGVTNADSTHALVQVGDGPFDGTTTGHFSGSANGTVLAINASGSYGGRLVDFQWAGVSKFNIGVAGLVTINGNLTINGNINSNLAHTGSNIGFFSIGPVARPAAYTISYTGAASRTLAAYTSPSALGSFTGIASGVAGTPYAQVTDLNSLRANFETIHSEFDSLLNWCLQQFNDMQAYGLLH